MGFLIAQETPLHWKQLSFPNLSSQSFGAKPVKFPKFTYIRSPALLKACRELPCQYCGRQSGTVVAAHGNSASMGKGRGIKASDQYVASLCYTCHAAVDQGRNLTSEERWAIWWPAHQKTVRELHRLGLWPQDVPLPDIRDMQ
jgi:hypothetical protein